MAPVHLSPRLPEKVLSFKSVNREMEVSIEISENYDIRKTTSTQSG